MLRLPSIPSAVETDPAVHALIRGAQSDGPRTVPDASYPGVRSCREIAIGVDGLQTCPAHGLPAELLSHILNFCHIRQVCVCMSVSRLWESAARSVIRTWEVVILRSPTAGSVGHESLIDGSNLQALNTTTIFSIKAMPSLINCLNQMVNVRILLCDVLIEEQGIKALIIRNSNKLRTLSYEFGLPYDRIDCYQNLRQLVCRSLTPEAAKSCPCLQKLNVWWQDSVHVFERLPAETMQELDCCVIGMTSEKDFRDLVTGLNKLVNLKKFHFKIGRDDWSDPRDSLNRLFDNFNHLSDVQVVVTNVFVCLDVAVSRLVCQNPGLQSLTLRGMTLTDDALISLSRVRRLTLLILDTEDAVYTMDAMLTLVRGGSRHVLQKVSIWHQPETDWTLLESEIELMSQETGRVFRVRKGGDWIRFKW